MLGHRELTMQDYIGILKRRFWLMLICAIVLIITWRHDLAGLVANPIASLYDGGTEPPDPHPAYSVALARQKQGRYLESVAEIRKQLERFPTDVEGQLLLAQIEAEDLRDLPAAELTIQHFCEQPGHAPQNVVFALYSLADWHLKIAVRRPGAPSRRSSPCILTRSLRRALLTASPTWAVPKCCSPRMTAINTRWLRASTM